MNSSSTDRAEIRKFGAAALVFFGLLTGAAFGRQKTGTAVFFALPAFLGAGFVLLPGTLAPLYRLWRRLARRIGAGITLLMLTLAYYLVVTPFALVMRLLGRRPLPLRPKPNQASYWVVRSEPAQPKARFEKRF